MRYFYVSILVALILVSCSTSGENPATETALQATVVARATSMARALRGTDAAQAAQAAATAQARQEALRQAENWPVLIQDAFDDNALKWYVGEDTGEYADVHWQIKDGKYRWQATAKQGFLWWNYPPMAGVADFYINVDAQQVSGPAGGQVGLFFRQASETSYYAFMVRNDGLFSLYGYDETGWTALIDWTPSPAIRPNEVNRLGVWAHGKAVALAINEQWVADYAVEVVDAGLLGLMIGMGNEGEEGTFEFDNFEVRVPSLESTPVP